MNYRAQLYPIGYQANPNNTVTQKSHDMAMNNIIKMMLKYRLPYDISKSHDGFTLIEQTDEPYKRTITRKAKVMTIVSDKNSLPDIVCTQLESGRYEWHYTKTGRKLIATFAYDAEREVQMRKEIQRGIDKNILGGANICKYYRAGL